MPVGALLGTFLRGDGKDFMLFATERLDGALTFTGRPAAANPQTRAGPARASVRQRTLRVKIAVQLERKFRLSLPNGGANLGQADKRAIYPMRLFDKLRALRAFEQQHHDSLGTVEDRHLIGEIGYHQGKGKPLTLKQLFLLDVGSIAGGRG